MPEIELVELVNFSAQAFRSAMRIAKNESDAEEIRQEALVRFLATPPSSDANLNGWFGMVGRNIALSRYRHQQVSHRADPEHARSLERYEDPIDILLQAELVMVVDRAISTLPARNQWIIRLRYFEGWGNDKVSQILGIPVGTVMSGGHRALQLLRGLLASYVRAS